MTVFTPMLMNGQKLTLICEPVQAGTGCANCPELLEATDGAASVGMALEHDGRICLQCAENRMPGLGLLIVGLDRIALSLAQFAIVGQHPDTIRAMSTQAAHYALELGDRFAHFGTGAN